MKSPSISFMISLPIVTSADGIFFIPSQVIQTTVLWCPKYVIFTTAATRTVATPIDYASRGRMLRTPSSSLRRTSPLPRRFARSLWALAPQGKPPGGPPATRTATWRGPALHLPSTAPRQGTFDIHNFLCILVVFFHLTVLLHAE